MMHALGGSADEIDRGKLKWGRGEECLTFSTKKN